jgi:uncharacterized protein (TIGR02996 family)
VSYWQAEWKAEAGQLPTTAELEALRQNGPQRRLTDTIEDNATLGREIAADPDNDEPRRAYAAWLREHDDARAQAMASFIAAQLRVASAYREAPHADTSSLRIWDGTIGLQSWNAPHGYASIAEFRSAGALREWLIDDLAPLSTAGLIGWPQFYRGAVERVTMQARRFLEFGEELFRWAPIRHLVLTEVPSVIGALCQASPLGRIRSLSLPCYRVEDALTDEALLLLARSPHVHRLNYLRLVQQSAVTHRGLRHFVRADTLPRLSCLEVFGPRDRGDTPPEIDQPSNRRDRMLMRDTSRIVVRLRAWVDEVEGLGHEPALHPERYYRAGYVDPESVVEHPIAGDERVMANRGTALSSATTGGAR